MSVAVSPELAGNPAVCRTEDPREGDVDTDSGEEARPLVMEEDLKVICAKEMALLSLIDKTGYNMVQENGQRKYGGPPPGMSTCDTSKRNKQQPRGSCGVPFVSKQMCMREAGTKVAPWLDVKQRSEGKLWTLFSLKLFCFY